MPHQSLTAGRVAAAVGGELLGPDDLPITGVAPLDKAGAGDLAFLDGSRHLDAFRDTRATVVLIRQQHAHAATSAPARIVVEDPLPALVTVMEQLGGESAISWGIDPTATIGTGTTWTGRLAVGAQASVGRNVRLGADCVIDRGAVIEDNVQVGDNCRLGPGALIGAGTQVGHRSVIHGGARIGGEGFAFYPTGTGHRRLPHRGGCVIEDDVEIGANTTIDRGSLGTTVVGAGTKIDNLVQIAHNVRIGKRCIIMAQVGVAGSSVVEDDVLVGGQAGLADHVHVERGARVAAQAGVIGRVQAGASVSGYPARSHRQVLRQASAIARLTPFVTRLEVLAAKHDE